MIICFMITVIGRKTHEIEIPVNTFPVYTLYGLPIIGIPTHKMGRIRDYSCMKHRITSVCVYSPLDSIMLFATFTYYRFTK